MTGFRVVVVGRNARGYKVYDTILVNASSARRAKTILNAAISFAAGQQQTTFVAASTIVRFDDAEILNSKVGGYSNPTITI